MLEKIINVRDADTALFYSISNCHRGLRGINFGNFLLKQVIEELRRDLENIRQFVTLSPVTGFSDWLADTSRQTLPKPALHAPRESWPTTSTGSET